MRIIFETPDKTYRIVEHADEHTQMDDLKGDCYNPECNPDLDSSQLRTEELHFEELVNREGVFGYVLEKWNPAPSVGYEHVDSCWGFVGYFSENEEIFNHYIVEELKSQIGGIK